MDFVFSFPGSPEILSARADSARRFKPFVLRVGVCEALSRGACRVWVRLRFDFLTRQRDAQSGKFGASILLVWKLLCLGARVSQQREEILGKKSQALLFASLWLDHC
ncbi:MAG: hypothetical protein GY771_02860 [bacterium]|nr:hypothetical protein [bacterium]